jgi:hypothetical protein
MKKKVIFGAAACMIAALSVVGLNTNKTNSSNVTLSDLVMTSDANADCNPIVLEYSADGKCIGGWWSPWSTCVWAYGERGCDPHTSY